MLSLPDVSAARSHVPIRRIHGAHGPSHCVHSVPLSYLRAVPPCARMVSSPPLSRHARFPWASSPSAGASVHHGLIGAMREGSSSNGRAAYPRRWRPPPLMRRSARVAARGPLQRAPGAYRLGRGVSVGGVPRGAACGSCTPGGKATRTTSLMQARHACTHARARGALVCVACTMRRTTESCGSARGA
jgi:hypothetical protein